MPAFSSPSIAHIHSVPAFAAIPTRFYLHNAATTVSGTLPSAEQSTARSPNFSLGAQTVNKTMSTTIGTSQASISGTPTNAINTQYNLYVSRWISAPIDQTSVGTALWTLNFAGATANIAKTTSPTILGFSQGAIPITCYVWRPSTGARIGYIKDADSNTDFALYPGINTEKSEHGSFAGSAVSCQPGDVIVLELFTYYKVASGGNNNLQTIYFDGTTVTNSDNTTVSSHAAYLETPEVVKFQTGTTLIRNASDTTTLSESRTRTLRNIRTQSDINTASESIIRRLTLKRLASDTKTLSESLTRTLSLKRLLSNTIVSDSFVDAFHITPLQTRSTSDTTTLSENIVKHMTRLFLLSNTVTKSESISSLHFRLVTPSDTTTLSESLVRTLRHIRTASDTKTLSESIFSALVKIRTASRYYNLSESLTRLLQSIRSRSDTTTTSEDAIITHRSLIRLLQSDIIVDERYRHTINR